ncbi:hypothetical protein [Streptosporangium sp. NPDC002721]|uniref:hypothetical protein n=1 Tax=Streptosporangium sp. NPDC002721 TaxID=3366188 RepID=UPI0036861BA6
MTGAAPVAEAVRDRRDIATRTVRWAVTHGDGEVTAGWVAEVATPAAGIAALEGIAGTVRRGPGRRP